MKKSSTIFISLLAICLWTIVQSNSDGPASNGNRATNAPGDGPNRCTTCHSGGSFGSVSLALTLKNAAGNEVNKYIADSTYSIEVSVSASSGSPSGYGFQLIGMDDNNSSLNAFENAGSGVQLSTANGRQYAEHSSPGSNGIFTVDWTAPSEGSGDVTFYLGGNAVNGDNDNDNDNAALADFSFEELDIDTIPAGMTSLVQSQTAIYPNPSMNVVFIPSLSSGTSVEIIDIHGRSIRSMIIENQAINVSELESGIYYILSERTATKFMKL